MNSSRKLLSADFALIFGPRVSATKGSGPPHLPLPLESIRTRAAVSKLFTPLTKGTKQARFSIHMEFTILQSL